MEQRVILLAKYGFIADSVKNPVEAILGLLGKTGAIHYFVDMFLIDHDLSILSLAQSGGLKI